MNETPLFMDGDPRLFGVFHAPALKAAARLSFLFCHPFGEEKLWTHRVFVSFARRLAARGHPVLRFDYAGNGDSEGDFGSTGLDDYRRDIGRAADELRRRTGASRFGLLGLRLGATLAALTLDDRDDIGALVLWAPVTSGAKYAQELLRINVATQMAVYKEVRYDRSQLVASMREGHTVNVDGYPVCAKLFDELSAVVVDASTPARHQAPCLIAHLDRAAEAARPPDLDRLAARFPGSQVRSVQEEPFWKEIQRFYDTAPNLFQMTLEWLDGPASAARQP